MSARPGVSPAVTPEKRGSAAAVPPPRRVQNSCYENLIDGMCCQLPGKISRPPLTKRKNGKEQGSSGRPGCAGSGASAGSRKKDPRGTGNSQAGARLRSARRNAPWPLAHRRKCRRPEGAGVHTRASPETGRKDTGRGTAERRTVREAGGAGVYPTGSGKTQRQPFNSRKFLRAASCGTAEGQAKSKEACGAWRMTGYSVRRGTWPRFCGLW